MVPACAWLLTGVALTWAATVVFLAAVVVFFVVCVLVVLTADIDLVCD
jgi:hypothetical protein